MKRGIIQFHTENFEARCFPDIWNLVIKFIYTINTPTTKVATENKVSENIFQNNINLIYSLNLSRHNDNERQTLLPY